MHLLFLGVHGRDRSPSQRYRFEQFEAALTAAGVHVSYAGALTADEATDFYGHTPLLRKARLGARALLRRAHSVTTALLRHPPDVVFVQREAFFLLGPWSEWLASLRAPVVFDFDDAIWLHAVSDANRRFAFLKNVAKVPRIVRLSRTVIAGNEHLATWARQHTPNVTVIPTVVDTDVFCPPAHRPEGGPVTIGWSGSPSTVAHLRPILPALEAVKARFGARVRFRAMGDPGFHHPPLNLQGEAWSPAAEVSFLQAMDIGLMPLPDDEWSKGKCGLKALTSMASGAATVVSPVGVNTAIVQHEVNGLLASTEAEWVAALSRLVEDAALRRRLGEAGRRTAVDDYSVQRWAPRLIEVLRHAAGR